MRVLHCLEIICYIQVTSITKRQLVTCLLFNGSKPVIQNTKYDHIFEV